MRKQTPRVAAARIVAGMLTPREVIRDSKHSDRAYNLAEALGGEDVWSLDKVIGLQNALRAALPRDLYDEFIAFQEAETASKCAHLRAGLLIGYELGRAIPKGGR